MIKVLHVLGGLGLGGAESRIMDLYRHADRNKIRFDFLVHMDPAEYKRAITQGKDPESFRQPQHYDDEVRKLGGSIYALPAYRVVNHLQYVKAAEIFFARHHDYNVVQGHMTSTASIYLSAAGKYRSDKAPYMYLVAHTRNAGIPGGPKGMVIRHLRRSLPDVADSLFACSHLAGDETFGGAPYAYVPNTIDVSRFLFDMTVRNDVRREYGISDEKVLIGNVARFESQKNQPFLIRAFAAMQNPDDAALMFVGDGPDRAGCESLCKSLGLEDRVIFAGRQKEIHKYYAAMDVFAFPSIYEGLPGVMVEAQASGLECLMSDTITTDVCVSDRLKTLGINDESIWTKALNELVSGRKADRSWMSAEGDLAHRRDYADVMREAGFDVTAQAGEMSAFYADPIGSGLT